MIGLEPVKNKIIIQKAPVTSKNRLLLDDSPLHGTPRYKVIAVGKTVEFVREGDLIVVEPGVKLHELSFEGHSYFILTEEQVASVVTEQVEDESGPDPVEHGEPVG